MADRIHLITGTDEGTVAEKALELFEKLKPEGGDDFSNDIIEGRVGDSESASQVCAQTIQALQTRPFFGNKVVWLRAGNFFASDRTSEAERSKTGVEALLEELKIGLMPEITFILSAGTVDKRRAFYKWMKKEASMKVYDKVDTSKDGWEEDVMLLVKQRARPLGLDFTDEAMDLFVQMAGEDTRQIGSELQKLDLYLGKERREVSLDDVRTMVPLSRKAVVFEIGRAIEQRNAAHALHLIDQQLSRGENAVGIMRAAIIPTVRNLFNACSLLQGRGLPLNNYGSFAAALEKMPGSVRASLPKKKDGGISAYPIFLAAGKARRFTIDELRASLDACLKADMSLIFSADDHRMVLHRLVAELVMSRAA